VFQTSEENGVYAPGHNSFFTSPDGKEDWILYHANTKPGTRLWPKPFAAGTAISRGRAMDYRSLDFR
jgi:GH43 family beta-xylosidase